MSDIPRRKIDSSPTVIEWIRMVARSSGISSASASGFYNMGIVNGVLQWVDSVGAILRAAPAEAKYIVQTADSALQNEQALSSLSTGMMKVTTGTGVITSVPWTEFYECGNSAFGSHRVSGLLAAAQSVAMGGSIPSQITTITSARIRLILGTAATGNGQYDLALQAGTIDEQYNAVTASANNQTLTLTSNNDIYEINATSLFASVTGSDSFGVLLTNDKTNDANLYVMGILLEGY